MTPPTHTETRDSQVVTLLNALLLGIKVDRSMAFRYYHIADLRSRISNLRDRFGIVPDRETVPGKRYLRYFIKPVTI